MAGILLCPFLISALCDGVRGEQIAFLAFLFGQVRLVAVYRRAGSVNKLFNAVLTGGFEHIERARNIVCAVEQRHLDRARNAAPSRLIEHEVHALACLHAGTRILYIAFDELIARIVEENIDVFLFAGRKIVQTANSIAEIQDRLAEIRSDESRTTCYKEKAVFRKADILITHIRTSLTARNLG